jgi:hypothetical protein
MGLNYISESVWTVRMALSSAKFAVIVSGEDEPSEFDST